MLPAIPEDQTIPTQHELMDAAKTEQFGDWLESQLVELEDRFVEFTTVSSTRTSLNRS